jgi:NADH:ubiquinone oxidoreductase subunit 4 (subunit M)
MLQNNLLSLILFIPTIAAVVLLFFPENQRSVIRWTALLASLLPLLLSLVAWVRFNQASFDPTGFTCKRRPSGTRRLILPITSGSMAFR